MICKRHKCTRLPNRGALAALAVCLTAGTVTADTKTLEEIALARSANHAVAQVTDAQRRLEQWNLDQLQSLRDRGFASWLEVARQQLLVDTLHEHRQASRQFAMFLQQLGERARAAEETIGDEREDTPRASLPPITVSLPGSVRLVSWLEPEHVSANLVSQFLASQHPPEQLRDDAAGEVERAEENAARWEERFHAYSELPQRSDNADRVKRAELQLALARAELELARLRQRLLKKNLAERARIERSVGELPSDERDAADRSKVGQIHHFVTLEAHPDVRQAALRVAAAEARANGEERAAKIALQRQQLRLQAMEQLHASGHADRAELEDARERVAEAKSLVEELRNRQASLNDAYERLKSSVRELAPAASSPAEDSLRYLDAENSGDVPDVESCPLLLLADPVAVRHLIDLRRQYYDTAAQRGALEHKLTLLKTLSTRLQQAASANRPIASRGLPPSSSGGDLQAVLTAGKQRELEFLNLDIRYSRAQLQAAEERLQILALEDARFVRQCLLQQAAVPPALAGAGALQFDVTGYGAGDSKAVRLGLRRVRLDRSCSPTRSQWLSYVESRDTETLTRVCELAFSQADIEMVRFAYCPPRVRPALRMAETLVRLPIRLDKPPAYVEYRCRPRYLTSCSYGTGRSIYSLVNDCLAYYPSYRVPTYGFRYWLPSYSDRWMARGSGVFHLDEGCPARRF
jgi:hypothetical protein